MKKIAFVLVALLFSSTAYAKPPNWTAVQAVFSATSSATQKNAVAFSVPRTDLTVTRSGITLDPALGIASEISATGSEKKALVVAELALQETEVDAVMNSLRDNGFLVTALHNHLYGSTPVLIFLHAEANGNPVTLTQTVHDALALTTSPLVSPAPPNPPATVPPELQTVIDNFGQGSGTMINSNVLEIDVARRGRITEKNVVLQPISGTQSEFFFQSVGGGNIATVGQFALSPQEVDNVEKALRVGGITVTGVNNHFIFDNPRLVFVHYWATGDPATIANSLKAAFTQIKK